MIASAFRMTLTSLKSRTLGKSIIPKREFATSIDNSQDNILPEIAKFIKGHEQYYSKCHELGVPFNEARSIARFLETLEKNLPETFTRSDLQEAITIAKNSYSKFNEEEVEILKSQLKKFELNLEELTAQISNLEAKADRHADRILKLGLGVLCTQWVGICYGTFILYGWDVMEPFSYMVGSTWMLLGFGWFLRQRQEFYPASFRDMLYSAKLDKLIKKEKISLQKIELLKKNIEMVRNVINELD